jgi:hypothetical protein
MEKDLNLSDLILTRKGSRSYERLSKDCGGLPTANRLQQIATKELNEFPNPDTIRGLSRGLGSTITDVTLAAARSLGLNVRTGDPDALVLANAGLLPVEAQEVILAVTRQMLKAMNAAESARREAPPGMVRNLFDAIPDHAQDDVRDMYVGHAAFDEAMREGRD